MSDPTKPPAGWYDDGSGRLRYWDGETWTEHFAPVPAAANPEPAPVVETADASSETPAAGSVWAPPTTTTLPEATTLPEPTELAEPTELPGAVTEPEAVPSAAVPPAAFDDPSVGAEIPYGSAAYGEEVAEQPTAAYPTEVFAAPVEPVNPAFAAPAGAPAPTGYGAPAQPYGARQQPYGAPAQPYGAPQQPYGAPAYGAPAYGAPAYGAPPYTPAEPKKVNVLGIVALGVAVLGLIGVCIPFVTIIGLVLLVIAFVLSIVSLFLKGQKWPGFVGLGVSVVGAIIAGVVLVITLLTGLSTIDDDYDLGSDSDYGSDYDPADESSLLEPEATASIAFGETATFPGGLEAVVAEPEPFTPSSSAAGNDYAENFIVRVTVTNTSDAPIELDTYTELLAGGKLGSTVYDTYDGTDLGTFVTETIAPGESFSWIEGWSVESADDLVFYFEPSYDDDAAAFTDAG